MKIPLTSLTEAGGCGCKLPPNVLKEILRVQSLKSVDKNVLVDHQTNDDAAVYKISDTHAIVSSLDFFTPIVDDPFVFGQIAAANSLSDIYAMGGQPIWALSILGAPMELLGHEVCNEIMQGAAQFCKKAKVSIVGGHSIANPQPIFGLAVNGIVETRFLKQNTGAQNGDYIFLTKPLGLGILSTALKHKMLEQHHYDQSIKTMLDLNDIGITLSRLDFVNAITDVTGFGFLGHLLELCLASNVNAVIDFSKIKILDGLDNYVDKNIITSGGKRNLGSFESSLIGGTSRSRAILSDPQTNGGLIVTVKQNLVDKFQEVLKENNLFDFVDPVGRIFSRGSNCTVNIEILNG